MDKRILKTHAAVYAALKTCLDSHPDCLPTVTELCIEAKINKTTFYRNFKDMDEFAMLAVENLAKRVMGEMSGIGNLLDEPELALADVERVREKFADELKYITGEYLVKFQSITEKLALKKISREIGRERVWEARFVIGGLFGILAEETLDEEKWKKLASIIRKACSA